MQRYCLFIISLVMLTTQCFGYKYMLDVVGDAKDLIRPCDGMPNLTLYHLFDLKNLTFIRFENGTHHVYGNTEVIVDLPLEPFKAKLSSYKLRNGKWIPTLYNGEVNDICPIAFSPNEPWSALLENTPIEQKTCPIKFGQKFYFDLYTDNLPFEVPDRNMEGRYKIQIIAESAITKQSGCLTAILDVFEV